MQMEPDTEVLGEGCTRDNLTCDWSTFNEKKGDRWVECLCPGAIKLRCPFQDGDWWETYLLRKGGEKDLGKEKPDAVGDTGL